MRSAPFRPTSKNVTDDRCLLESLLCLRRAGADVIFTYGALDAARALIGAGALPALG